ncbi:STAS domain-containing protein [Micromonospora sp. NPDC005553]
MTTTAYLSGDLDVSAHEDLAAMIDQILDDGVTTRIVIDLDGTEYLDSVSLNVLIKGQLSARGR